VVVALVAGVLIVLLVAWQAAVLTAAKARQPAAAAPAVPVVPFRKDPQGWIINALRRKKWLRRTLSLGSLGAFVFAIGVLGYPFYTNLVQSRIQDRLNHQLASPELRDKYLAGHLQEGDSLTRIKIPAIDVDVVVVEGTGADALRAGAGHYTETALPCTDGTVGIAGHRTTYGRPFNRLGEMHEGDIVYLDTPFARYEYKAVGSFDSQPNPHPVSPDNFHVVGAPPSPNDAWLTLTTCHPKGSAKQRLILRLVLTNKLPLPKS